MTFTVENGTGVASANSYVSTATVLSYLTDRNRHTDWAAASTAAQQAAAIAATDYIETRFSQRFKGEKEWQDLSNARGLLTFTTNPLATQTVTLGVKTYRFVSALTTANDVLIDSTVAGTVENLIGAINGNPDGEGVTHGTGTIANSLAYAYDFYGLSVFAVALLPGVDGNSITSTATGSGKSWTGGLLTGAAGYVRPQPLSFPRRRLYDRDWVPVVGLPQPLIYATCEYAARALSSTLAPDMARVEINGSPVQGSASGVREKVGPIETEITLQGVVGGSRLAEYPAADMLLADYIDGGVYGSTGGRLIRG